MNWDDNTKWLRPRDEPATIVSPRRPRGLAAPSHPEGNLHPSIRAVLVLVVALAGGGFVFGHYSLPRLDRSLHRVVLHFHRGQLGLPQLHDQPALVFRSEADPGAEGGERRGR